MFQQAGDSYLLKGGKPQRRMYVITPIAQRSTLRPYLEIETIFVAMS